ncbi:S1 family peptidase [Streptosporangium sp. NBC_01756]|uniref:S1 family peptidase n=1 Tax=Streptosporangium sp. NBC_01756 TaxID=2975950 RepID=UPI002DDA25C7|nr:S1 family peptidase [Streptosporangium sp. NBC_01756]WSC89786.1 S1 family peptidase [Streptosporangium sp. NBC_01756]
MPRRHTATTGCVLAITALVSTAVPAVAQPLKAAVAAAPAALKPPPGMLEALQRDLHLTKEQAQTRLLNEIRLTPVEAQLRSGLGDEFGGSWFAGDLAQTLVVATTDQDNISQIVAAGARGEVVSRSLAQLDAIIDEVDAALSAHDSGLVRYVDVKTNKVVILSDAPATTEDVIQAADVDPVAVRVVSSIERPQPLSDLVGGEAYYIGSSSRCSIGFSVTKGTQSAFVSAGHCGKAGATTTGFNQNAQGVFQGSIFPGSDYSWVSVNNTWTPKPSVKNGTGGTVNVAGSREAIEGASVCRSGSTTGWHCGTIQQRNTSVTYPQGIIAELVRTNVCAEPGDSGGSFISVDQAQGVTSGGSGDCNAGGVTYFQPIGEILTAYGLTLTTSTGSIPPPPPPPTTPGACTGYAKTVTGTLTSGQSGYQPNSSYYRSTAGGLHSACLDGPAGADFDLYLQKWNGQSWVTVATSDGPTPDEKTTYTGTAGYYRYRVAAFSGSGAYSLAYSAP